jgi:hypothetical protein
VKYSCYEEVVIFGGIEDHMPHIIHFLSDQDAAMGTDFSLNKLTSI